MRASSLLVGSLHPLLSQRISCKKKAHPKTQKNNHSADTLYKNHPQKDLLSPLSRIIKRRRFLRQGQVNGDGGGRQDRPARPTLDAKKPRFKKQTSGERIIARLIRRAFCRYNPMTASNYEQHDHTTMKAPKANLDAHQYNNQLYHNNK